MRGGVVRATPTAAKKCHIVQPKTHRVARGNKAHACPQLRGSLHQLLNTIVQRDSSRTARATMA